MTIKALSVCALFACAVTSAQTWNASPSLTPFPNDTTAGTTQYRIAKMTGTGQAVTAAVSDTYGFIGIVQASAGTSGTAGIAQSGIGSCQFDGSTIANDYVVASLTAAGKCHDAGAAFPTSGVEIVGRVVGTNAGAGTYAILIYPPEIRGSAGGTGGAAAWGAITGTLSSQSDLSAALGSKQNTLGYTAENVANKNTANGYAGLGATSQISYSQIPVGTGASQVAAGNDARFGNATSLNGTSISAFNGIPKLTSGNLTAATSANIVSLFTGCTGTTFLRADGVCASSTSTATWGNITGTLANQTDLNTALSGKQNALGFTPENIANKNVANGYAGLGTGGLLSYAQIPVGTGASTVAAGNDLRFLNATSLNGTSIVSFAGLPWFTAGAPAPATAGNIVSLFTGCTSGYLKYDGTCSSITGTAWGGITGTLSNQTDLATALAGKAATSDPRFGNATSINGTSVVTFGGIPWFTSGTPTPATASNVISLFTGCTSGYLQYNGTCSTPSGSTWGNITGTLSAQTDLSTALSGKASTSDPRFGNATSLNGTSIATFGGLPWFTAGAPSSATYGNVVSLWTNCTVGYLKADGTCSSPSAPAWGAITGTLSNQTDLNTALSGKASITDPRFLNATSLNGTSISAFAGLPWFVNGTPASATYGNVVSMWTSCTAGYLKYDGTCSSPGTPTWGSITGALSNQTDLSAALAGKASSTDSRFLNATSLNGTSIATFGGIPKFTAGTPAAATSADVISLFTACTSGYLRYDGTCSTPTAVAWGNITGTLSSQTDLSNALAGKQAVLGYTPENSANRNVASGYAGLNASSQIAYSQIPVGTVASTVAVGNDARFLNATSLNGTSISAFAGIPVFTAGTPAAATSANIISLFTSCTTGYLKYDGTCSAPPAPVWGNITGTLSSQTDLNTALSGKASSTDPRFLNATSLNGTSIASFGGLPWFTAGAPAAATSANIVSLWTSCTSGYLRYDGTCSTPPAGTVTNFSTGTLPAGLSWLTQTVTNPTTTPQYSLGLATGQAPHQFIGTGSGSSFGPVSITQADIPLDTYTVGAGGVTQNVIVASSANAGEVIVPAAGACGFGVAQSNAASGGTVAVKSAGLMQVMADGAIPVGHLVTCSSSNGGYVTDTGAITTTRVLNTIPVVGVVTTASTGAGTLATIRWHGPGIFGTAVTHSFTSNFSGSGSALVAGAVATTTVPYACVINSVNITIDSGGATFDVWKVGMGASMPTSANSIVGSNYPTISGGTPVHSTTLAGWTTSVNANDIVTFQLKSVTGAPQSANIQVVCQ